MERTIHMKGLHVYLMGVLEHFKGSRSAAWDWDAIASRYSCSGGTADEYLTPQRLMKLSAYFALGDEQGFALPDTRQLAAKLKNMPDDSIVQTICFLSQCTVRHGGDAQGTAENTGGEHATNTARSALATPVLPTPAPSSAGAASDTGSTACTPHPPEDNSSPIIPLDVICLCPAPPPARAHLPPCLAGCPRACPPRRLRRPAPRFWRAPRRLSCSCSAG
eukprot:Tamp_08954.p3 GENE.Tamp_08954~~Tamp_08954.p3  ORF type:complete len:220 (-),score=30.91 Tamp_08954:535-1194(-)